MLEIQSSMLGFKQRSYVNAVVPVTEELNQLGIPLMENFHINISNKLGSSNIIYREYKLTNGAYCLDSLRYVMKVSSKHSLTHFINHSHHLLSLFMIASAYFVIMIFCACYRLSSPYSSYSFMFKIVFFLPM